MPLPKRNFLKQVTALGAGSLILPSGIRAQDDSTYRVAIIGHTGRGDYGHGLDTLWKANPRTTITAVADPVEEGREKARKRLQLESSFAFESYREMLSEVSPDIVAVAPRHVDQHATMAVAAAEAGARGIYIEKPFVTDLVEADQVIAACRQTGTKLAIAHRNRYHPVLPVLKELIADGKIGTVLEVRCRGKEDRRGGCLDLWVLGSHILNLAHYFTAAPVACSATILNEGRPISDEDVVEGSEGVGPLAGNEVHARFETADGIPIFFDSVQNRGTREAGFGLQIIGTEGVVDLRADREPLAHIRLGSPFLPSKDPATWLPVTSAGIDKPEPIPNIRELVGGHQAAVDDLITAIEKDREPLCNPHEGRVVVEMTLAVFASHRAEGKRIPIPLVEKTHAFASW